MQSASLLAAAALLLCARLVHCQVDPPPGTLCDAVDGKPSCVCAHPDGTLDLTSIASSDGTARWSGLQSGDYTYAFNPCNAFSESGDCSDAHVCQNQDSNSYQQNIGDKGTEQIYYDTAETDTKRQLYVYYTGPSDLPTEPREVFVYLICDKGDTNVTALGEPETLRYEFEVRGQVACFGGAAGVAAGLAGLILMLLLIVGFALYCVIGAVIMKVKFEKTGSEIIPNKHFWTELPLMLKDGVLFTFSPCVSAVQKKGTYSSL